MVVCQATHSCVCDYSQPGYDLPWRKLDGVNGISVISYGAKVFGAAIAAEKAGHRVKLNTKTGREAARKIFAESIGQRERVVVTPAETLQRRIERMSAAIADMKTQLDGLEALPEGDEPAETGKK